jgi:hypothetical protein
MNTATHYYLRGMGQPGSQQQQTDDPSAAQLSQAAAAGASTAAAQIIHGNYVGAAGTVLMTAARIPGPQAIFLAIAGAVAELLGAIGIGKGCGSTCIVASEYANQAETLLQRNLNTYLSIPVPRYQSQQTAALNIFDQVWAGLISPQACGNPALGDAGKRCISDRQRGACKWKAQGVCWNWFIGYRDPIANDPNVVPDPAALSTGAVGVTGAAATGIDPTWLIVGAAGLLLVMVLS